MTKAFRREAASGQPGAWPSRVTLSAVSTLHGGFFFPDLLVGTTFRERLVSLRKSGFQSVEIWGKGLPDEVTEVRRALQAEGIRVSAICGGFRGNLLAGDKEERLACYGDFLKLLEASAALEAAGLVFVPIFSREPQVADLQPMWDSRRVEMQLFLDIMGKLTARAEGLGTCLLVEPVNRYETHFLNRLEQAAAICGQIGSRSLRVTADFFHMNLEEADVADAIRKHGRHIGHVHMVDSNRFLPGQGHFDFRPAIRALKEIDYEGALSLECFALGNAEQAVPAAAALMKSVMENAK